MIEIEITPMNYAILIIGIVANIILICKLIIERKKKKLDKNCT